MARTITPTASRVIEQLELDGDFVVTIQRLDAVMRQIGQNGDARTLAYELQRDGWLGKLRTRHAWEFLPGARGGPFGSGDRFIEFRAQHAVHSEWAGVLAFESAASVLGLAQRIPEQEVVALPDGEPFPKALTGDWRHVRVNIPKAGIADVDGLPAWSFEGLLVGIATRPSGYRDVPGLAQWLETSGEKFNETQAASLVKNAPAAVRQRTAYLLVVLGKKEPAEWLVSQFDPPRMTAWFGPHEAGGRYDPLTKVNDTLLAKYLDAGSGA